MPNNHLQAISRKLESLRGRFYLVVLWHCLLICSLLVWLGYIAELALGQAPWLPVVWGLVIPFAYAGYRLLKRPSLDKIAAQADRRCQLNDELVTAWQYRDSEQPALPLLLEQVSGDLDKIKPSLLFSFRISPHYTIVAVFLAGCSWYFYNNPWHPPASFEQVQSIGDDQLKLVVDQMEIFRKELNKIAPGSELPKVTKTVKRLQQLTRELDYPETRPQVMPRLQELKAELEQAVPDEATMPEAIQGAESEHKPALLELEIKSDRLAKMMQKLSKLGLSSDQIQNQALRELVGLLDRLIQFNMPGPGTKPGGSRTQAAGNKAGFSQSETKLSPASLQAAANAGSSGYNKLNEKRYQSKGSDWSVGEAYRASSEAAAGELSLTKKYSYLPGKYQQQVYAVLADQQIPLYYRRQVRDYFDALRTP